MDANRRSGEGGFTIIEVMIAVVILTVGLLGLTTTSGAVTRMIGRGQRSERGAMLAMQRMEQARVAACIPSQRINASETVRRSTNPSDPFLARVSWTYSDAGNQTIRVRVIADFLVSANRIRTDTLETSVPCLI